MVNEILSQKGTGLKIICLHLNTFVNITAPKLASAQLWSKNNGQGKFPVLWQREASHLLSPGFSMGQASHLNLVSP